MAKSNDVVESLIRTAAVSRSDNCDVCRYSKIAHATAASGSVTSLFARALLREPEGRIQTERLKRFAMVAMLAPAVSVCLTWLLTYRAAAQTSPTYSCGNPNSGHCYGTNSWQEKPQYFGAYTDILQVPMGCPSGCGGFVDDEIWLTDAQTQGCASNQFGQCWVEAGYFFTDGSGSKQFFWADSRPLSSSTFNLHILGGTDPDGVTDHFMLIKDSRGAPDVFQIWVYNDSLSTLYNGTSTSNAMTGSRVIIGQELAGTQNAAAGTANFSRNIWAVQPLGPEYVFWYNRQTDEGSVRSDNPPFASWNINPANPPPPEGGQFSTHCCQ